MRKFFVSGNIGKNPELKKFDSGVSYCFLSIGDNDRRKVDGEWKDVTVWSSVKCIGKTADTCCEFLQVGQSVAIEGNIDFWSRKVNDAWENNVTLVASRVEFGKKTTGSTATASPVQVQEPHPTKDVDFDDDVPF